MAKNVVYELSGVAYNIAPNSAYEIQKAPLGRRLLAVIIDVTIFVLLSLGIGRVLTNQIINNAFNYQTIIQNWQDETVSFGFARIDGTSGDYVLIDFSEDEEALDTLIQTHGVTLADRGLATIDEETSKYVIAGDIEDQLIALEELFYANPDVMAIAKEKTFADFVKTAISTFLAQLLVYLVIPLVFKNGQTLGKIIGRVGVIGANGLKVKPLNIILRFLIGIFLVETLATIVLYSISELFGILVLLLSSALVLITTKSRAIHDLIGGTVVVDMNSQYIIDTMEEKILAQREEYKEYNNNQKNKKAANS